MLEPDGTIRDEVVHQVARLSRLGIPVCAVTSKTAAELRLIVERLGLGGPSGFENGAGLLLTDGRVALLADAVPLAVLREVADKVREETGAPLRTFEELGDDELRQLTGLAGPALAAARERHATLPLVIDEAWDETIAAALPPAFRGRVLRGNRFLHLQGRHDKVSVLGLIERHLPPGDGSIVACGDSPNDAALLAGADIAIIVPSTSGPHPQLCEARPDAIVAPLPHGAGWAAALEALIEGGR
jgi:mannosyl-3-phosphoglycerate phosphatase family protein